MNMQDFWELATGLGGATIIGGVLLYIGFATVMGTVFMFFHTCGG